MLLCGALSLASLAKAFFFISLLKTKFLPTAGTFPKQITANNRLERASSQEKQWFLDTLNVGLPQMMEKLKVLDVVVERVMYRGTFKDMPSLEIESTPWKEGTKNLFLDGLLIRLPSLSASPSIPEIPQHLPLEDPDSELVQSRSISPVLSQSVPVSSAPVRLAGRGRTLGVGRPRRF